MKGLFHSKKDFIPIQNKRRQTGEKSSENRTASFIAIGLNSQAHMLKTQHYIDEKIRDPEARVEKHGSLKIKPEDEGHVRIVITVSPVEKLIQKSDFIALDFFELLETFPFIHQPVFQEEALSETSLHRKQRQSTVLSTGDEKLGQKPLHSGDEATQVNMSIREHDPINLHFETKHEKVYYTDNSPTLGPSHRHRHTSSHQNQHHSRKKTRPLESKDYPIERRISGNLSNSGAEPATRDLKKLYRYVDELISNETKKTNQESGSNKESNIYYTNGFGLEGDMMIGASISGENIGGRKQGTGEMLKIKIKVIHAAQFALLRYLSGIDHVDFVTSMSETFGGSANFTGGKSTAKFYKTFDELFIIKQVNENEIRSFLDYSQNYFDYVFKKIRSKRPFAISRIFACFEIENFGAGSKREFFFVMENVSNGLSNKDSLKLFDLKGSEKNRFSSTLKTAKQTLLDTNFKIMMNGEPLLIEDGRVDIMKSISSDAKFLSKQSVVDYSLLVAVDPVLKQCRMGIIDYAALYTTLKQVETILKKAKNLGDLPTIIQPEMYFSRFVREVRNDIVVVPTLASAK